MARQRSSNNQKKVIERRRHHGYRNKQIFLIRRLKEILREKKQYLGVRLRDDMKGFVIQNPQKFQKQTLPNYYKKWSVKQFYDKLRNFPFQQMKDYFPQVSFAHKKLNLKNKKAKLLTNWQQETEKKQFEYPEGTKWLPTQTRVYKNKEQKTQSKMISNEEDVSESIQKSQNRKLIEQKFSQENQIKLTSQIVRLNQEYERLCAQTFFYQKIRSDPDLKPENVIFSNDQSTYFRSIFFKKLHEYKMTKLGKLIHKMKTPKVKRRKLPFTMYINQQRELQKAEKIKFQNVSEDMKITENKISFSDGALHLIHDNHPVDIDEFFRYDWSKFEVMSFNNCGLTSADWVKISRNALQMLPKLKLLELNDNKIHMVRKNDFMKFVQIKKIELNGNQLDLVCQNEITNYQNETQGVIVEGIQKKES